MVVSHEVPVLDGEVEALMGRLKMPYSRTLAPDLLATAKAQRWEPAEVVRALLVEESRGRSAAMSATRRKQAGFPTGKTFESWNEEVPPIPCPVQRALSTLEWVSRRENLAICGPVGTGKSFYLEALGQKVIDEGGRVSWLRLEDLGGLIRAHRPDDQVTKTVERLLRADLVVVDDIGLLPVSDDAAEGLYRLVDAAYEKWSAAIWSNLHPSAFDQLMPKTVGHGYCRSASSSYSSGPDQWGIDSVEPGRFRGRADCFEPKSISQLVTASHEEWMGMGMGFGGGCQASNGRRRAPPGRAAE